MKKFATCLVAVLCASLLVSAAQQPANTVPALTAAAIKAYQAKDYVTFLDYEKRALALDPGNARTTYNVACGEALQGHAAAAMGLLNSLVDRKLDLGAETDTDFASIRNAPAWTAFTARLATLRAPLVKSTVAFRLDDPTLIATGIAVDPQSGDTYIASVRHRKILRRTKAGVVSDFIKEAQDGFLAGASLAIDAPRRLLIASTAATPIMIGFGAEGAAAGAAPAGVFIFDLRSGALVRKAMLAADGGRHFLNALAVDRSGNVYVSDSGTAGIYKLAQGTDRLERFVGPELFAATQGLAFSDDEKTLFVADYTDGLWALDLASKTRRHLDAPADVWLFGMDGLSRVPDGFVTVQIGVRPERVLRLHLDAGQQRIARVDVLEMSHPDYLGPIQGMVAGDAFLYIANSQLPLANGRTGELPADRLGPTVILRLPL